MSTIFLKSGCRIKFVCALLLGGLYLVGDLHFEKEKEKYTVSNFSDFDILHTNLVTKDRDIDYGENETAFIEAYKNLFKNIQSRAVQKNGLLIWPESSLPNFAFQDPTNQAITSTLLSQTPYAQHIVGTTSANNHLNYNSLYYVESVNPLKILSRYDKLKLIPIGEYNVISPGNSEYVRGRGVTTFMYGKTKILPLICYEGLWPLTDSARKALTVETQQRVIVIPSNDWWFQSRNLNRVLLFIHRWLALKNEVSVIKVSNGGYSYHITPIGEINIIETRQMMNILSVSLPFKRAP